jgi:hypothetical protein
MLGFGTKTMLAVVSYTGCKKVNINFLNKNEIATQPGSCKPTICENNENGC